MACELLSQDRVARAVAVAGINNVTSMTLLAGGCADAKKHDIGKRRAKYRQPEDVKDSGSAGGWQLPEAIDQGCQWHSIMVEQITWAAATSSGGMRRRWRIHNAANA